MQKVVLTVSLLICKHIISSEHWEHKYPLHSAAYRENTETIIALLNKGANINAQDDNGDTPLHKACTNKTIALLIQHDANVHIKNKKNRTPFEQAVDRNQFTAQAIIQYGFLFGNYSLDEIQRILYIYHAQLDYSLTSLYRHIERQYNKHNDYIKFYLRRFSEPADRPNETHTIINQRKLREYEGYQKKYRELLPLNPEKNYHSRKKLRLLQRDHNELPEIEFPSLQILCTSFLARLPHHIINAASPSMLKPTRISPHKQALGLQLTEIINNKMLSHEDKLSKIRKLINQGADVNTPDYYSLAPLQSAIFNKNTEIAQLLIQAGADINIKTKRDCTLLHIATCRNHIEIIPFLLQAGVDIDAQDDHGDTALHNALSHKNNAIAQLLIEAHTNLHIKARLDRTPLCTAVSNENIEIIPLLLQAGAHIDAQDNNLNTPLHTAAEHECPEMIPLLLQAGASVDAQNKNGFTPFDIAINKKHWNTAKTIVQDGFLYGRYTLQEAQEKITQYPQLSLNLTQLQDYVAAQFLCASFMNQDKKCII